MEGRHLSNRIIVFIAGCNPYRSIKNEVIANGLIMNANDEVMNLLYNVNPLPFSLLNYVFNFGSLKKEDEKKYISSMIDQPFKSFHSNLTQEENN